MGIVNNLLNLVESGREGKNIGISTGMEKLDKILYGIQKKYLYTIGASSGVGKTSFSLELIYNVLKNRGEKKVSIMYYSFEMSNEVLMAKLLSRYIYDEFGKIVTFEDILSLSKTISEDDYKSIQQAIKWLESVESILTVYDKSLTPNGIYATLKDWLKLRGVFEPTGPHTEEYTEFDEEEYKIVLIDHVGLIAGTGSKKERIDLTADYLIYFRNKCSISGIFIQQLNRGLSSVARKTNGYELVGLEDFKDSSGTTDASEVVIALYSPFREKVAKCEGYPIKDVLRSRFILLQVIKNRYGNSGKNIGTCFFGEINMFRALPRPEEINDYEPYLTLVDSKSVIKGLDEGAKELYIDEVDASNVNEMIFKL